MMMSYMYEHSLDMIGSIHDSRNNKNTGSGTTRILGKFYPDKILATKDVGEDASYHKISYLFRNNYLKRIDKQRFAVRYQLTLQGKCKVLGNHLKIRFLCLCILCEAYSLHKNQIRDNCHMSYVIQDLKDVLEDIYAPRTVSNAASILHSQGFTFHRTRDIIQLNEKTMKKLDPHQKTIEELHNWIMSVPMTLNWMLLKDPDALTNIRNSVIYGV